MRYGSTYAQTSVVGGATGLSPARPPETVHHRRVPVVEPVVVGLGQRQHVDDHVDRQPRRERVDQVDLPVVAPRLDQLARVAVDHVGERLEALADELRCDDRASHDVVEAVHLQQRPAEHLTGVRRVGRVRVALVILEDGLDVGVAGQDPRVPHGVVEDRLVGAQAGPERVRIAVVVLAVEVVGLDEAIQHGRGHEAHATPLVSRIGPRRDGGEGGPVPD